MAQAKRRAPAKPPRQTGLGPGTLPGLGILLTGIIIGSLGTVIWQGTRSADKDIGAGLRQVMEQSREQQASSDNPKPTPAQAPEPQQARFDFYTVLPEIEVVVPTTQLEPSRTLTNTAEDATQSEPSVSSASPATRSESAAPQSASVYMLQAGSYRQSEEAERLKARLALLGHGSKIQKITIQGRGEFYRVRLGPFNSHAEMVKADQRLADNGIQSLRLKVSGRG